MRVFVTGATGFVASAVVQDLLAAGHHVLGLARNHSNAAALAAAGAQPHPGDLQDLPSLQRGAEAADAVIHCGFIHDFTRFAEVCAIDAAAIQAMGEALTGSHKPFIVTSGTALVAPGRLAVETDIPAPNHFPRKSEELARSLAAQGVHAMAIRLPPSVHGESDHHGFISMLIKLARDKGVSAYVGEGANNWNAVHRLDAAPLYRLALEKGLPGASYHGVGDQAIPFRHIAEVIGQRLNLPVVSKTPEEAPEHFGWFHAFAAIDCPVSSQITQQTLAWTPTHPGLIPDLETSKTYFAA